MHIAMNHRNEVFKIYVQFDENRADLMENKYWYFCKGTLLGAKIKVRLNKDTFPVIQRTKFTLMLLWACTSHKVQGLSLYSAVVSSDQIKQKIFNCGQIFVALSKVRSLPGLTLTGTFTATYIKADQRAIQ